VSSQHPHSAAGNPESGWRQFEPDSQMKNIVNILLKYCIQFLCFCLTILAGRQTRLFAEIDILKRACLQMPQPDSQMKNIV
jgi:hypothetical protein